MGAEAGVGGEDEGGEFSSPEEFDVLVEVGFGGRVVVRGGFGKVGAVEPACCSGVVANGEEAGERGYLVFNDVEPNTDDGGDEFEEVDVCSTLEMMREMISPSPAVVGVASEAVFAGVSAVGVGGLSEGKYVHAETVVCCGQEG